MGFPLTGVTLSLAIFLVGSAEATLESNPQDCISIADFDEDTDYFPAKFVPHNTTDLFEISYRKTYKVITNKFQNKSYLLYMCGTPPPADEIASGKHHLVLPVPHKGGIAITQTPQIAPPEMLGKRREITAYIGNPKYVSSPCLDYMADVEKSLQIIYFPEDPSNSTLIDAATAEYMQENPDAIIFAGPTGDRAERDRHMAFAASQERTAVATFDWIGVYSALFNLEGFANEIVAETEERYDCSARNAAALTADLPEEEKKTVLWAQWFDLSWLDVNIDHGWSVASCPTWDSAFNCEFAHHCGADIISRPEGLGTSYTWGSDTLYWYLTDEEFLEVGKDADVWIYPSKTYLDVYAKKKELMDQFKAVQDEEVYDTQGKGEHAWHEQRLAEYDVVALDMCALVGNGNPNPPIHRRRWFRNVYAEAVGFLSECNAPSEIDEPYVPAEAECSPLVEDLPSLLGDPADTSASIVPSGSMPVVFVSFVVGGFFAATWF